MEPKYYIPSIEEFRVGFEFELNQFPNIPEGKPVDRWLPIIGTWNELDIANDDWEHKYDNFSELYRVKYLNKKDIESLGFTFQPDEYTVYGDITGKYIKGDNIISVYYKLKDKAITYPMVIYKTVNKTEVKVFDGIIKNLSELKVLLKQLGITERIHETLGIDENN